MSVEAKAVVAVVAADPLRSVGLQTILEESAGLRAYGLELDDVLRERDEPLAAVLIDTSCSSNLPELLARFRRECPWLRVVVVGDSLDPSHIQAVIGAGAKGYLAGTANEAEIRMAMEVVLDGSVWAPRKVLARLIESGGVTAAVASEVDRVSERMTPRERDVLRLLMEGRNNRQIAVAMGVDTVTVKAHLGRMMRKASVKNRVELTFKAMEELREA